MRLLSLAKENDLPFSGFPPINAVYDQHIFGNLITSLYAEIFDFGYLQHGPTDDALDWTCASLFFNYYVVKSANWLEHVITLPPSHDEYPTIAHFLDKFGEYLVLENLGEPEDPEDRIQMIGDRSVTVTAIVLTKTLVPSRRKYLEMLDLLLARLPQPYWFHGCPHVGFNVFVKNDVILKQYSEEITHDFGVGDALYLGEWLTAAIAWSFLKADYDDQSSYVLCFGGLDFSKLPENLTALTLETANAAEASDVLSQWAQFIRYCRTDFVDRDVLIPPKLFNDFDILMGPMAVRVVSLGRDAVQVSEEERWGPHKIQMQQAMLRTAKAATFVAEKLALVIDVQFGLLSKSEKTKFGQTLNNWIGSEC